MALAAVGWAWLACWRDAGTRRPPTDASVHARVSSRCRCQSRDAVLLAGKRARQRGVGSRSAAVRRRVPCRDARTRARSAAANPSARCSGALPVWRESGRWRAGPTDPFGPLRSGPVTGPPLLPRGGRRARPRRAWPPFRAAGWSSAASEGRPWSGPRRRLPFASYGSARQHGGAASAPLGDSECSPDADHRERQAGSADAGVPPVKAAFRGLELQRSPEERLPARRRHCTARRRESWSWRDGRRRWRAAGGLWARSPRASRLPPERRRLRATG
jgi:hypothetical protein